MDPRKLPRGLEAIKIMCNGINHESNPAKFLSQDLNAPKEREYVLIKVGAFDGAKALCKAEFKKHWIPIALDRHTMMEQGIEPGHSFEWAPNEQGIIKAQDIRNHRQDKSAIDELNDASKYVILGN